MHAVIHSIYRWTVERESLAAHEEALAALGAHIKASHPLIAGVRCYKVSFGGEVPRPGRVWDEVYASWADFEESARGHSPACDEAWASVYATMVPGTMTSAAWEEAVPDAWFDR